MIASNDRRRLWLPALALALASRLSAASLPERGLPAGRLSAAPMLALSPSSSGNWSVMRAYLGALGGAFPQGSQWASLDDSSGRLAAAVLTSRLPHQFWSDTVRLQSQPAERRAQMEAQFLEAHQAAAQEAGRLAQEAVTQLERAAAEGRAGAADLDALETQLAALSVYGGAALASYEDIRREAAGQRQRAVDRALAEAQALTSKAAADGVQGGQSTGRAPRLSKPAARRLGKAATWAGYGLLGVSAASMIHPVSLGDAGTLHGVLTWAGAASFGVGRFLSAPRAVVAASSSSSSWKLPDWLAKHVGSFLSLGAAARASADAHARFDAAVGDASWPAFVKWARSGLRTALYWFPLSLLGMLAGSALAVPLKLFMGAAKVAPADYSKIAAIPLTSMINGYVATAVLQEVLLLGVAFSGLRWALGKATTGPRALWLSAIATLAILTTAVSFMGFPVALVPAILGIEAVMIMLYARSGTLLLPGLARAAVAFMAIESGRMMAYLRLPAAGTLPGLPDWAGLGVAALLGVFLLIAPLKAQLARLRDLGAWWSKPAAGGAPKPILPMLALGLLWAVPCYLSMEAVSRGMHFLLPEAEPPTPAILQKMLLMPIDVIVYNFIIVAALEEWVFRRGVFKPMVDRIKKWGAPEKWWFWPAALASSIIFSGAHYIDYGSVLQSIGIGQGNGDLANSMAGAYAFTWASFLARVAGGMMLAMVYARSGLLLVPMIAHFGSNMLEAMGMRWGLIPFLSICAGIFALQFLRAVKPKPEAPPV